MVGILTCNIFFSESFIFECVCIFFKECPKRKLWIWRWLQRNRPAARWRKQNWSVWGKFIKNTEETEEGKEALSFKNTLELVWNQLCYCCPLQAHKWHVVICSASTAEVINQDLLLICANYINIFQSGQQLFLCIVWKLRIMSKIKFVQQFHKL